MKVSTTRTIRSEWAEFGLGYVSRSKEVAAQRERLESRFFF